LFHPSDRLLLSAKAPCEAVQNSQSLSEDTYEAISSRSPRVSWAAQQDFGELAERTAGLGADAQQRLNAGQVVSLADMWHLAGEFVRVYALIREMLL
jgi:hypothetical protein